MQKSENLNFKSAPSVKKSMVSKTINKMVNMQSNIMETYKNELPTTKTETMENTVLNDAFSVLANHIATSSEDALAANFIDSEKI